MQKPKQQTTLNFKLMNKDSQVKIAINTLTVEAVNNNERLKNFDLSSS